jgi:beta-lactam-binding protein with PASTA domain
VVEEEETPNEAKIGVVTRQSPHGGTELTPGSEVTLIVGRRAAAPPEGEGEVEGTEGEGEP